MINKKAKKGIGIVGWLLIIYLGLGVFYHLTKNPQGSWLNDLLLGGWNVLKPLFSNLNSGVLGGNNSSVGAS